MYDILLKLLSDVSNIQFCLAVETVAVTCKKLPGRRAEVFVDDFNDSVLFGCGAGVLRCGIEHTDTFLPLVGIQIFLAVV